MHILITRITKEMIFWAAWIIIPLLWEIAPAIMGVFVVIKKRLFSKFYKKPIKYPEITIILPVYNSAGTLRNCVASIYESEYPKEMMEIFLVDNGSTDESYEIFIQCQAEYKDMPLWWLKAEQGKSKALNLALFNSRGKYIFHFDSDGIIEKSALMRMVNKFEESPDVHCMTGTVLIDPELIENTEDFFMRLVRRCEMFEYCNAFLAGRNYESEFGSLYTLSGAFSAFRKSAILKTFLYNTTTVGEDTHVTFQIRKLLSHDIKICEDAIFFVDPIEDYNKLYTQRQRWQRGEIEVSHMFLSENLKVRRFFSDFMIRVLMYDHTFAFPRIIWYFAIIYLFFINYPLYLIVGSFVILFLLYSVCAFLFYLCVRVYLKEYENLRKYYTKLWYVSVLYPVFNFFVFFIRFAGIINSIKADMSWRTRTLSQEWEAFKKTVKEDFKAINSTLEKIRRKINNV